MLHVSYQQGMDKIRVKSSAENRPGTVACGGESQDTFHAREPKRQKKLSYGPPVAVLRRHAKSEQTVPHSDLALSKLEDCKSKGDDASIVSSTGLMDASNLNVDGSICALCLSSKTTEVIFLPRSCH